MVSGWGYGKRKNLVLYQHNNNKNFDFDFFFFLFLSFLSLSLSNTHTRMLMKSMEDILMDHPTSLTQDRVLYKKLALGDDPAAPPAPPAPPSKKNINSNKIVVSPDHLLMVQYTTFVKKTLHVGKFAEQKQNRKILKHVVSLVVVLLQSYFHY